MTAASSYACCPFSSYSTDSAHYGGSMDDMDVEFLKEALVSDESFLLGEDSKLHSLHHN